MRILLIVAYDGTSYSGWQVQPGQLTIEGKINEALKALTKEDIKVTGASRTDAGVSSLGNVCVFDTFSHIPPEKFKYALNTYLPDDIVVKDSYEVSPDFHPRHADSSKTYEYRIWNDTFPDPTLKRYSYFTYRNIDISKMREAASYLVGEHDFGAFCSAGSQVESTIRTIYSIDIIEEKYPDRPTGKMIRIRVKGSGFLYNMVRIISGTLIDIGKGLMEVADIERCLLSKKRDTAGPTAPAEGLIMIGIEYDNPAL
ncbi:MAG TPA: tRNA pseudouridine(38-40) synthase TruA [Lachnospiraceae bacterium]|nr:tRNA pseudouridine(38-40) synthase TruA [Lachnospiraceae bacterium]